MYALDVDPCKKNISGSVDKTKAGKTESVVGFAAYSAVGQSFTATLTTPSLEKMLNAAYNKVASWFK
jgi:hypothetical protein